MATYNQKRHCRAVVLPWWSSACALSDSHSLPSASSLQPPASSRRGYTLVEILTATILMIIIMMAVTVIFASVTDSIGQARATLEMSQRLRATGALLKQDLENQTAIMAPPAHPRDGSGYLQYVEGPIGPVIDPSTLFDPSVPAVLPRFAWNSDLGEVDTTVGDMDDILMFTAKSEGKPYVGLIDGKPGVSNAAEIIWFVRGTTLYRRVLLVKPEIGDPNWLDSSTPRLDLRHVPREGFYQKYDLSVRKHWDPNPVVYPSGGTQNRPTLKANSLADLTRPECRTFHNPDMRAWTYPIPTPSGLASGAKLQRNNNNLRYLNEGKPFPYFLRPWLGSPSPDPVDGNFVWVPGLGLPILAECSDPNWVAGDFVPTENPVGIARNNPNVMQMPRFPNTIVAADRFDAWANPHPWDGTQVNPLTGVTTAFNRGTRPGDDVVLTNVIGFDVKAWDPNAAVFNQVITDPSGSPIDQVVVMPGDPGYIDTVQRLRARLVAGTVDSSGIFAVTGAYVDLNYLARIGATAATNVYPWTTGIDSVGNTIPIPSFHHPGNWRSLAYGTQWEFVGYEQPYDYFPSVYDTWSLHYEYNQQTVDYVSENPTDNNRVSLPIGNEDGDYDFDSVMAGSPRPLYDEGSDGLDNEVHNIAGIFLNAAGNLAPPPPPALYQDGVDDVGERETQPPYAVPLQGIQVRIRVFEPGSRQVREVTLVQKFRTK